MSRCQVRLAEDLELCAVWTRVGQAIEQSNNRIWPLELRARRSFVMRCNLLIDEGSLLSRLYARSCTSTRMLQEVYLREQKVGSGKLSKWASRSRYAKRVRHLLGWGDSSLYVELQGFRVNNFRSIIRRLDYAGVASSPRVLGYVLLYC